MSFTPLENNFCTRSYVKLQFIVKPVFLRIYTEQHFTFIYTLFVQNFTGCAVLFSLKSLEFFIVYICLCNFLNLFKLRKILLSMITREIILSLLHQFSTNILYIFTFLYVNRYGFLLQLHNT